MRHNQNGRRFRGGGRNNGQGHHNGGGHHHHNNSGQRRSVNPRVQTFDSNGPEVRIRGNAIQINEKYLALAKDASSAGDRVLAESYLQHAEHYQRMLNEINEEYARHQPQQAPQQQPSADANGATVDPAAAPQPGMSDLDQGFLVGPRHGAGAPDKESETA